MEGVEVVGLALGGAEGSEDGCVVGSQDGNIDGSEDENLLEYTVGRADGFSNGS